MVRFSAKITTMASETKSKINLLLRSWIPGTVAVVPWLEKQGIYQQLAYEYEQSGWLDRVGHGAYARPGDHVEWFGGVYAIQQQLELPIHVGGKSALELKGLGHFASAGSGDYLYLFGTSGQKLPSWFLHHDWNRRIAYKMPHLFAGDAKLGLTKHSHSTFDIQISAPERAMLELLHLVPKEQSAEEAVLLMEGLGTLRPKLVQELLECCQSIKAKRLFLALAAQCGHSWVKRISFEKIDLGKGKRVVVPGGVLDNKYLVTLPRKKPEE